MSAREALRKYVHLLSDAWTPRETTDARVEELYGLVRAEVLAEAKVETVGWLVKKAREYRAAGGEQNARQAEAIELLASKVDRGAVRAFLGTGHYRDVIDEQRAEVRREILGDDLNPSTLVLDAQAYRRLADDVSATMPDPDRWDGDDDDGTILARYVRHLAAQLALTVEFRVPLPEGLGGYGEVVVKRESSASDRWAVTDGALVGLQAWADDRWQYVTDVGRAATFVYSLDDALDVAEHVARVEQEKHDARIRANREGGAE
ncbi:hypothetical protein AB0P07_08125 [Streptomyces sp. NPDC085944]|uniref:hypothetical protein n=1 Tax=Streptomyces sp. NPDC085944 TaxID=3154962 RepID=UPI00342DD8CB